MLVSLLLGLGVFGEFSESDKESLVQCLRQYSDNLLFLFDGEEFQAFIDAAAQLRKSKIIIACRGKADHTIRSLIIGISDAGRNSLLHRYLNILLGSYNIGTHLPKLRRFCSTLSGIEIQDLAKHALFIQFICVLYFKRHCNTLAIQQFLSRRDVLSDLIRSFLVTCTTY